MSQWKRIKCMNIYERNCAHCMRMIVYLINSSAHGLVMTSECDIFVIKHLFHFTDILLLVRTIISSEHLIVQQRRSKH
jgi:hypothetical protein